MRFDLKVERVVDQERVATACKSTEIASLQREATANSHENIELMIRHHI